MLQCGIVLDSLDPSAWVARVVEGIQAGDYGLIVLVLMQEGAAETGGKLSLFRMYEEWDHKRNRVKQDALAPTSAAAALKDVKIVPLSDVAAVRAAKLDVVLDFGSVKLPEAVMAAARLGVWRMRHDLDFRESEGRGGSWEALERNDASESLLVRSEAGGETRVLSRSSACLERTSLYRSRNPILWKSAEMVLRELRAAAEDGIETVGAVGPVPVPYRRPTDLETAGYLMRYAQRWMAGRRKRAARPAHKWHIAIRKRSEGTRFDDPAGYTLMECPEDRFYADPFLFERDGKTYLFFEDFRYELGRAILSCSELDEEGRPGEPFEVLRRPYHLSYPFVFEDGGEIYMMPETRGNRTVEMYRAVEFPFRWEPETVLMQDVNAVDATIYREGEMYWMFTGTSDGRYSNCDEVSLYFASALQGPWTAHPMNPLVSDVLRARPAGLLFRDDDGRLIRPSQDCGRAYGYGLVFSEVVKLTETEYEEQKISEIKPEAFAGGVANHTYNRTEKFEVVDRDVPWDSAVKR